jgi:Ca2+-binding EF-hand superfamily protein
MIRVKKSKAKGRLLQSRKEMRETIEAIANGSLDAYMGFRRLYAIYLSRSALHQELKPFFEISGVEPDGTIQVDETFRSTVRALARKYLSEYNDN